jgi:sugar-specific transcriptional regulator TrmB
MFDKRLFEEIGLTKNESDVYLILLQTNEVLAAEIAAKTRISRPHVYDSLKRLIDKGMASYVVRNGKRHFRPTDPEKILQNMRETEDELERKQEVVRKALPELKALFRPLQDRPRVEVYDGYEGIKTILNDIISTGKELLAFNSLGEEFLEYIPEHVIKRYLMERKKRGIRSRQFYAAGARIYKHPMVTYKRLPHGQDQVALFVYGNNVVLFVLVNEPLAIRIRSDKVAKLYRRQFETLWAAIP